MRLRKRNKLVFGVGVNDADYLTQKMEVIDGKIKQVWRCHYYITWRNMLKRCYSEKYHSKATYKDCFVCEEWLTFSNFKKWMETQDWEGKQLDKDLLKEDNKIYSPEYCIFVDRKINLFVTDCGASRGEHMIGVCWNKNKSRFVSYCSNTFTGKIEYLGVFNTELEAHLAWKNKKHEHACKLAESELVSDPRLAEALKTRYV